MAIAQYKPDEAGTQKVVLPQTQKETYKGIVADNRTEPLSQMLPYIDGMPWAVNWYGQLLGEHNEPRELDTTQSSAFQQYVKTSDLEARVLNGLSHSYDGENNMSTVTGSMNIHTVVPNLHDYFVSGAGSRKTGLYRVSKVERKTFNRASVYQIDYVLVEYLETGTLFQHLEGKVVRQYRFVKDRLVEGVAPILREEVYELTRDIHENQRRMEQYYFKTFMNLKYQTLLVPGQAKSIYDAWVMDFLLQIVDTSQVPEFAYLKRVSIDRDLYLKQGQLWSLLVSREFSELPYVHQHAGLVDRLYFNRSSWIKSAAYWGIDLYVYPRVEKNAVALDDTQKPGLLRPEEIRETEAPSGVARSVMTLEGSDVALIKPVLCDDYYVLSKSFYEQTDSMSCLEILVRDYLKRASLDLGILSALIKAYRSWPVLEQFYYGPILILLMKESVKGFYDDIAI